MTNMHLTLKLVTLMLAIQLASLAQGLNQFQAVSPPTRGQGNEKVGVFPCGGSDTVSSTRTSWKLGGRINVTSQSKGIVKIYLSLKANPLDVADFTEVASTTVTEAGAQSLDFPIQQASPAILQKLGIRTADELNNKDATIAISFEDANGVLSQCSDVKLTTNAVSSGSKAYHAFASLVVPLAVFLLDS